MSSRVLCLAPAHVAAIVAAARSRFPAECCGLLEGASTGRGWVVRAIHETGNLADHPERRFLIDPQFQIGLLRALRGTGRGVIGCFHSHPGGRAEPSPADLAGATERDFLWLIVAVEPDRIVLSAYLFTGDGFETVELQQSLDDCRPLGRTL